MLVSPQTPLDLSPIDVLGRHLLQRRLHQQVSTRSGQPHDLDKRNRATVAQGIAGVLDQEDAVAMTAPLREQRDLAQVEDLVGALEGCELTRSTARVHVLLGGG